jgi:hypothetical protein
MRIVVSCPDCHEQRVSVDEVTVRNCVDDGRWSYRFVCPQCRRRTVAPAASRAALAVVAGGARLETWTLPMETKERPSDPPLTETDLVDLRASLSTPGWVDSLSDLHDRRHR